MHNEQKRANHQKITSLHFENTTRMGLISAYTLIRTISLFHITAAYFFLTSPRVIADQNVVVVLGESMRMV